MIDLIWTNWILILFYFDITSRNQMAKWLYLLQFTYVIKFDIVKVWALLYKTLTLLGEVSIMLDTFSRMKQLQYLWEIKLKTQLSSITNISLGILNPPFTSLICFWEFKRYNIRIQTWPYIKCKLCFIPWDQSGWHPSWNEGSIFEIVTLFGFKWV